MAAGGVSLSAAVSAAILKGHSRLKAIRESCDVAQMHLSFKTNISQGYLSDLESGRRAGTSATIAKIADALGVPVEWLS